MKVVRRGSRSFSAGLEEVFHGSIWYTISPMLATDDVVRLCVVASRWNECDRYGSLGHFFFTLVKLEQYRELWHYDGDGSRVKISVRRRTPIMEGIRTTVAPPLCTSYFDEVRSLRYSI